MKKIILIIVLVICSISSYAQDRELFPVDWEKIETTVATMPDSVKSLVQRLAGPTLDKTLTWDERRLAIYGQSIISGNKERGLVDKAIGLFNEDKYKEAIQVAQKVLEINPLNVSALNICQRSIGLLNKTGVTTFSMSEGQIYYNRERRIYNTIATTGDGSIDYPFYVTSVPEEYCFMRYYMNLWEYESQSLVGTCDEITLAETSEYYSEEKIYFEVSRLLKNYNASDPQTH